MDDYDSTINVLITQLLNCKNANLTPEYIMMKTSDLPFPDRLRIEPTNFCNIKCAICPTHELPINRKGFMNLSLFNRILDELDEIYPNKNFFLTLYLGGEPLMHKRICDMIYNAASRGHYTHLNTNCKLLDAEMSADLIKAGLNRIIFSFDDMEPDEFDKIRSGSSYYEVYNNIKQFCSILESLKSKTPEVIIGALKIPRNTTDIPLTIKPKLSHDFVTLFRGMPVKIISSWAHHWAGDYIAKVDDMRESPDRQFYYPCSLLWKEMTVRWNGEIVPCCYDLLSEYPIGNFPEMSLLEIWNSENYSGLREAHKLGRAGNILLCRGCSNLECSIAMNRFFRDTAFLYKKKL